MAQSAGKWKKLIGAIAEEIAQRLFKSLSKYSNRTFSKGPEELISPIRKDRLPTPLTGSNRSEGRQFEVTPIRIEDAPA
jgi:hypothetical protein